MHKDGQDAAYEYDPATDTWRSLADMKLGRGSVGVAALDGKLHAIGGRWPDGKTVGNARSLRSRDQQMDRGRAAAEGARPCGRSASSTARFTVAGGRFGASTDRTDMHDIYDPKTNTWTAGPPLPTPAQRPRRHGLQRIVHGARRRNAAQAARTPRTKPTTPRPTAGARSRRCRAAVTPPAPPPTANTSISPAAP